MKKETAVTIIEQSKKSTKQLLENNGSMELAGAMYELAGCLLLSGYRIAASIALNTASGVARNSLNYKQLRVVNS